MIRDPTDLHCSACSHGSFARLMLTFNPDKRPSAQELLTHKWLTTSASAPVGRVGKDLGHKLKHFQSNSRMKKVGRVRRGDQSNIFGQMDANGVKGRIYIGAFWSRQARSMQYQREREREYMYKYDIYIFYIYIYIFVYSILFIIICCRGCSQACLPFAVLTG